MPELPEVTALARWLDGRTAGTTVAAAELAAVSVLKTFDPPLADLPGRQVVGVGTRGKFLIWEVSGPLYLVVHLARAGWLKWADTAPANPARPGRGPLMLRLVFASDTGELAGRCDLTEAGTRKSTAVYVVADPADVPGIARLGPSPLAMTPDGLADLLAGAGRAQLKGVLRDQQVLAGIGNAYSDEILHAARLSPFKPANGLSAAELDRLDSAIQAVLAAALERAEGLPPERLKDGKRAGMAVHGRTGEPCPVCGDSGPRGLLRGLLAAVLPHLSEQRKAAGRPADVEAAEVTGGGGLAP